MFRTDNLPIYIYEVFSSTATRYNQSCFTCYSDLIKMNAKPSQTWLESLQTAHPGVQDLIVNI